jgi:chloramphenicol-sensitive protein RarD
MNWFLYVWAIKSRDLFAASMAYYICPLLTMAGATILFKERYSPRQKTALLFLLSGVALPAALGGAPPTLALLIAAFWSGYTLIRRFSTASALEALFAQTLSLTIALSIFLPLIYGAKALVPPHASGRELVLFVVSGCVTAAPIVLLMEGMKLVPLRAVGMLQYIAPTLTLVTSVCFLGVHVSGQQVVSLALIWMGLVVFFSHELGSALIAIARDSTRWRPRLCRQALFGGRIAPITSPKPTLNPAP